LDAALSGQGMDKSYNLKSSKNHQNQGNWPEPRNLVKSAKPRKWPETRKSGQEPRIWPETRKVARNPEKWPGTPDLARFPDLGGDPPQKPGSGQIWGGPPLPGGDPPPRGGYPPSQGGVQEKWSISAGKVPESGKSATFRESGQIWPFRGGGGQISSIKRLFQLWI